MTGYPADIPIHPGMNTSFAQNVNATTANNIMPIQPSDLLQADATAVRDT
jgi:hypothetical protein